MQQDTQIGQLTICTSRRSKSGELSPKTFSAFWRKTSLPSTRLLSLSSLVFRDDSVLHCRPYSSSSRFPRASTKVVQSSFSSSASAALLSVSLVLFYLQREGAKSLTLSSLLLFQACWLPFCRISVLAHEFLLVIILAEISFSGFHLCMYVCMYLSISCFWRILLGRQRASELASLGFRIKSCDSKSLSSDIVAAAAQYGRFLVQIAQSLLHHRGAFQGINLRCIAIRCISPAL